jgi:hypothetical protein
MIIRVHGSWKESVTEDPNHDRVRDPDRRAFIGKAAKATVLSLVLPQFLAQTLARDAMAATAAGCSAASKTPGGLMHIFSEGGPTMGARFLSPTQAQLMSANVASRYGINPATLKPFGGNGWAVAGSSPFGQLLTPPPGVSASTWAAILANVSVSGVFGPFNQDDGAGDNLGQLGGSAGLKPGVSPSDILIGVNRQRASWAAGLAGVNVSASGLAAAKLSTAFALPAAGPVATNTTLWGNAVNAMSGLAKAFDSTLGTSRRNSGSSYVDAQVCGASSAGVQTDPTYGSKLFDPAQNAAITSNSIGATLTGLSTQEQAILSAAFRSADGTVPGVLMQFNGRDYHGTGVNNTGPKDYEEAQAIKMWLLASALAGAPAALMYNANGQAIANGTGQTTVGGNITVDAPSAQGDAGGAYNAGFLLLYNPRGRAPSMRFAGNFNTTNGDAKADPTLASIKNAIGAMYYTAFKYLNTVDLGRAYSLMKSSGVTAMQADLNLMT